jgi:signal transduction histidine kinase
VRDNGRGIDSEVRPRIFEPFFTTKQVWSNVGLGLSVSWRIVAAHGGRIEVESRPGEGSTFTVVLPAAP